MGDTAEASEIMAMPTASAPLTPQDRIVAIDVLRGVALFGVMAINLVFEFRVSIFEQFLPASEITSPIDRTIETLLDWAIASKAFALFSLLFGIGLAVQFDRLAGRRRTILLLRRLTTLLAIGLLHLTLVWNGDILTEYALAGFVALPFLFGSRLFLVTSGLLFLILYLVLPPLMPLPDPAWMTDHIVEARRVYGTGTFRDVLMFRIGELPAIAPLHIAVFPRTLALFLLGAFIWRTNVLRNPSGQRDLFFGGAIAGLLLTTIAWGNAVSNVTLAFAYGAFIIGLMSTEFGSKLLGWAAPLGRMAFTNYITQSLIFGWVFYGYGFGLFGQVRASVALAFGVAIYAAQVIFSRWWLKRFNFGPVELLWRTLMYGASQPMRRNKAAA